MDDLKREHRWRHWKGHWEERIQQAGREGGSMQQEQEAGGEAKEGEARGANRRGRQATPALTTETPKAE